MRYSRPHSNTGFNDLWPAMDFSLMFEHSQMGVMVQKIKHGTGNFSNNETTNWFIFDSRRGLQALTRGTAAETATATPAHGWRKKGKYG